MTSSAELIAKLGGTVPSWHDRAACAAYEEFKHWWFPAEDTTYGDEPRQICSHCPVRSQCLEYAITLPERYGMWGGTTPAERKALLRKREVPAA